MIKLLFPLILSILLGLSGCFSQPEPKRDPMTPPSWTLNPNKEGHLGAVGIAGRPNDQKPSTQRKLAVTRALDELSMQMGVKVELSMTKRETVHNQSSSNHMDSGSTYKSSHSVTAHIEDMWKDPLSGELYVWMVVDK